MHGLLTARARMAAGFAAILALGAAPATTARAAESAPVSARLTIEPSVGASLALVSDDLFVQVYLPGSPLQRRSPRLITPVMLLSIEGTEVVADSAVSLRIEHRGAAATSPGENGEEADGGALLILAQFN